MSVLPQRASVPELRAFPLAERPRAFARRFWRGFYDAISARDGWRAADPAWANRADALIAHASIETDNGNELFWWNFGYIVGSGPEGDSFVHKDTDTDGSLHDVRFAAWRSERSGIASYVARVARGAERWRIAGTDPDSYLIALRRSGWLSAVNACGSGASKHTCSDAELVAAQRVRLATVREATADLRPSPMTRGIGVIGGMVFVASALALVAVRS